MEALSKDCRLHGEIGMVTLKVNGLHVVLHRLAAHVARINAHFVDVVRHEHLLVVLLFLDGFVGGGVGGVAGLEAGVRLLLLQLGGDRRHRRRRCRCLLLAVLRVVEVGRLVVLPG